MNCQKCKIEIEERDPRRERLSDAATAHLSACASCRVFDAERLALGRLVGGLEKVCAPADFDFRMRARMAAEASAVSGPRARWFNFSPAALSWPLAACFALVISATLYFQPRQQQPPVTGAQSEPARAVAATTERPAQQPSISEATPQDVPQGSVETRQGGAAQASKNSLAARQRVSPAVRVAARSRVDAPQVRLGVEESTSAGLLGANVKYDSTAKGEGALIPVQVSAQERPLKVLLRETGGGARTISVESVSFGSRDVIGRPATISKASLSTNQGVW